MEQLQSFRLEVVAVVGTVGTRVASPAPPRLSIVPQGLHGVVEGVLGRGTGSSTDSGVCPSTNDVSERP